MNIGIDIDDTITKTSEEIDFYAKEYTEKILKRKFEINENRVIEAMWAQKVYNWTVEEDKKFWKLYYEKIMENVLPKENVVEVINKLYKNNTIVIITARWDKENNVIEQITKKWLDKNEIKYNKIFLGYEDKRKIVQENNIDIFIDDNLKTCELIADMNINVLMMNTRLNKNVNIKNQKIERVFSWKEIEEKCTKNR